MRKHIIILLVSMLAATAASAQVYYRPAPAPWTGDKIYGLHIGSFYKPAHLPEQATAHRQGTPLSVSLRVDGETAVGTHFALGFQAEANYSRSSSSYTLDGDSPSGDNIAKGQWLHYSNTGWDLTVECRLLGGYYITETWELQFAVGLYEGLLNSQSSTLTREDKADGTTSTSTQPSNISLSWNIGLSSLAGVNYYFNDNLFLSAAAKASIPFQTFLGDTPAAISYGLMLGINYKFIR